jgi:hypothetical protein
MNGKSTVEIGFVGEPIEVKEIDRLIAKIEIRKAIHAEVRETAIRNRFGPDHDPRINRSLHREAMIR